jgi:hypothetical protein
MPNVWTRSSLSTPRLLKDKSPAEQKRELRRLARDHGAGLDDAYFTPDGASVYALFHLPGDANGFVDAIADALRDEDTGEPPEIVVLLTLEEYLDELEAG